MGKGKLVKFAELEEFGNVLQKPESSAVKGKWASDHFKNEKPVVLELACGKGDYTLDLAKRFPDKNFIGIDIKGARLHVGARKALKQELHNVRFLRIFIDNIDVYFADNEVSEIWITFPDPYLKKENKRLTAPKFLTLYKKVLQPNGIVQLKTDSAELYQFTQEVVAEQNLPIVQKIDDVYKDEHDNNLLTEITTHYERMHLKDGRTIRYIAFKLEA